MQIGLFFVFLIALLIYFLNRQRSQMNRLRTYRRFQPDWSRSRAGARRRRRSRFSNLRAEMTRLEEERAAREAHTAQEAPGTEKEGEPGPGSGAPPGWGGEPRENPPPRSIPPSPGHG